MIAKVGVVADGAAVRHNYPSRTWMENWMSYWHGCIEAGHCEVIGSRGHLSRGDRHS